MNMACAYALLGWTLNVELLGYRACTFSILIDISQLVSRVTIPIYIPTRRPSLILDMVVVVCVCMGGCSSIAVFLTEWEQGNNLSSVSSCLVTTDAGVDL